MFHATKGDSVPYQEQAIERRTAGERKRMIRHIVFWKLKEHAEGADKAANARRMKEMLDACADLVPGILRFDVALAQPGLEATSDVMLFSEFASMAVLDAYQHHPQHQALKPFFSAVRESRECMDVEC